MDDDQDKPSPSSLEDRVARARARGETKAERSTAPATGLALAFRLSVELAAGLVAGAIIGWLLDQLFSSGPVLMVVFLFLGAAAGVRNAVRVTQRYQEAVDETRNEDDESGR